jgi:hypothetical protein
MGLSKKKVFWTAPWQRKRRNEVFACAEGTKAYINAVFGPFTGQKLHLIMFFVPSAE